MSPAATIRVETLVERDAPAVKGRAATLIGRIVFISLLGLIALIAIPYGTSQPWWRAAFVCAVFALAILWLVEGHLDGSWFAGSGAVITPLVALVGFSLLQTIQLPGTGPIGAGIAYTPWNAISVDPYQTRFFALELAALVLVGVFLFRYASSEKRLRILINVVIGVAVASALFGILRQTIQRGGSFVLPLLSPDLGYGQFINKNHFAFLMEMGFGLALGLSLTSGMKRERSLLYFALLLPLWIGVTLSGSRGGLIALAAQLIVAALLYGFVVKGSSSSNVQTRFVKATSSWPVRVLLGLVLLGGIVVGTVWIAGDRLARTLEESRLQLTQTNSEPRRGVSRGEIWKATRKMFLAHPFMGVGMGAYWAAVPAFHDASGAMTPQEAHNDYLEILASGGLVAFGLVGWFAFVVVQRTRESLASANRFRRAACFGATIGLAGVAVHSLLDFGLHTMINALVFTTLIVIATSKPQWAMRPEAESR